MAYNQSVSKKRKGAYAMAKEKIIYYSRDDEEFSGITKKTIAIDKRFKFLHKNIFWRIAAFIVYRIIMTPFAFIYCKLKFSLKTVGREKLRKFKSGCMMYSNHTLMAGDAFLPHITALPKTNSVIVNADNVSTPGTKNFIMMCGAIPIPTDFQAYRAFMNAVEKRLLEHACVTIYPEAHIWPYYTGIRKFSDSAFRYPVKYDVPIFVSTTTFQKKKHGTTPRVTVYIDGPFYAEGDDARAKAKYLRDKAYETLCLRSEKSTYSPIAYIKKEEDK